MFVTQVEARFLSSQVVVDGGGGGSQQVGRFRDGVRPLKKRKHLKCALLLKRWVTNVD